MKDITGLLVTHKRASIDELGRVCKKDGEEVLDELIANEKVDEAFVIQTCNRAEFYISAESVKKGRGILHELEAELPIERNITRKISGTEAARHLMNLACGLESMVIGEDEVLGQLKDAYHQAADRGYLDGTLDKVLMKSIHIGERARNETPINEGNASMGSAAVEKARNELGGIDGLKTVVVGTGDMGENVVKSMASRQDTSPEILVANRTYGRAESLADEIDGEAIKFGEIGEELGDADMVISATSAPHLIFDRSDLEGYELLILDLANPRDVDAEAEEFDNIEIVDIDDLDQISDSSLQTRRDAADEIERMIEDEIEVLEMQLKKEKAGEILSSIYARAEELRIQESEKALEKLREKDDISHESEEIVHDLTESIVNKMLSTPTEALKNAAVSEDYETLRSASEIFRLDAGSTFGAEGTGEESDEIKEKSSV
ncbi:MAG: glutamyl-tRNA reductase [Halobacteria archaeon]